MRVPFLARLLVLGLLATGPAKAQTLSAVLEAEVVTLDPHFTGAYITRTFGYQQMKSIGAEVHYGGAFVVVFRHFMISRFKAKSIQFIAQATPCKLKRSIALRLFYEKIKYRGY